MKRNYTSGSVLKNILLFSLPYLLSYFLQTLYGMADLFIIGQFDDVASTTAVSIGSQVMHMLTVMIVGLAMGTTVSIAQAIGAGNAKEVSSNTGNTITLFMMLSLVMMVLLLLCRRPIVSLMSTPTEAIPGTIQYLTICFVGIPFITAYNIISSIFRGMGDSKTPMYFIAIACVSNILLDYLFIGALHMGPSGAALGTTLSQAISVMIALIYVYIAKSGDPHTKKKDTGITLCPYDLVPKMAVMCKILRIGVPVALQDGLIQISFLIITIIANQRGLTDAAAVGIVEKIISFLFLVPSSMLSTVSALGAQNIGADKPERARLTLRYAISIAAGFGLIVAVLIQFTANPIVGLFTSDADAILAGGQYLRGYIWDCVFAGIHFSFSGYFCACEHSGLSFLHNITAIVLMRVPGVYLTSRMFPDTLLPMGLATATGSLVSVIICIIAYNVLLHFSAKSAEQGSLLR